MVTQWNTLKKATICPHQPFFTKKIKFRLLNQDRLFSSQEVHSFSCMQLFASKRTASTNSWWDKHIWKQRSQTWPPEQNKLSLLENSLKLTNPIYLYLWLVILMKNLKMSLFKAWKKILLISTPWWTNSWTKQKNTQNTPPGNSEPKTVAGSSIQLITFSNRKMTFTRKTDQYSLNPTSIWMISKRKVWEMKSLEILVKITHLIIIVLPIKSIWKSHEKSS